MRWLGCPQKHRPSKPPASVTSHPANDEATKGGRAEFASLGVGTVSAQGVASNAISVSQEAIQCD